MFSDQDKTKRVTASLGGSEEGADAGMISGFGKFRTNKDGNNPYLRLTFDDLRKLIDVPPSVEKDKAQWLIPSTLESRVHREQERSGKFWMLWVDVDWKAIAPRQMTEVAQVIVTLIGSADFEIYASKSATEARQKCRILIPMEKPLCGVDWITCQRILNGLLLEAGIEPDVASEGPGQLLYLPNRGEWYESISKRDGALFQPMTAWSDHIANLAAGDQAKADAIKAEREARQRHRASIKEASVPTQHSPRQRD